MYNTSINSCFVETKLHYSVIITKKSFKMGKKIQITLRQWFDNLPAKDQKDTLIELCEFLGKSEETVYRWIRGAGHPDQANRMAIESFTGKIFIYEESPKKAKVA
ncbi:MAG: hypothetical protein RLZ10_418 [Bacteroidota bacterium]